MLIRRAGQKQPDFITITAVPVNREQALALTIVRAGKSHDIIRT